MIRFTDPRLYLKGTSAAYLQDSENNIVYFSNKFQTANVQSSVTMGEIRAGIGNPIAMMIPSDSGLTVNFAAADFSLFAKSAQLGAGLTYGAPVMVCQTVTATGAELSIDVSEGTPVAAAGASGVVAFVQEVGALSPVATGGTAYAVNPATGAITGFTATAGTAYKVWYHISRENAQIAAVNSLFDPAVYRFTAEMAVYSSAGGAGNQGTHVGNLIVIVPSLKLGGDGGGITGDQTTADTTSITGQALSYDSDIIDAGCDDCGGSGSVMAYYIYVPCDTTSGIDGLTVVGGVISIPVGASRPVNEFRLVMNGNQLVQPDPAKMSYTLSNAPEGTTISGGVISAGSTAGEGEIVGTYTDGTATYTATAALSVVSA